MNTSKYLAKLNSWFIKFKRYKVTYKQGFFHLSNLANSPYTIIESFDKMPFCKHLRTKKLLTADTPFLRAELYYNNPQEGLCVFVSDLLYKKNLMMSNIYDKNLPLEHHFINLHFKNQAVKSKSMIVSGTVLTDKTWTVFKAGEAESDYHFKDSNEQNITIYFTTEWLKNTLEDSGEIKKSKLWKFFLSNDNYIVLNDDNESSNNFLSDFRAKAIAQNDSEILKLTSRFFEFFEKKLVNENITEHHFNLTNNDRKYVQKAEKYLLDNLFIEFPGIEFIAEKIGISATKLKANFKVIHNKTLYEYYSYYQMKMAHELLLNKSSNVKEVAKLLGYENPSKFAAKFKEQYDVVPSSLVARDSQNVIKKEKF